MFPDIFFELSLRSVRINFLRSILASIGIIIGVVAISAMGMLGTNLTLMVKDQLSSNANVLVVTTDVSKISGSGQNATLKATVSDNQVRQIKQVVGTNRVIPLHRTQTNIKIGADDGRAAIYGLNPDDVQYFLTINEGNNIRGTEDALVGATLAQNFNLGIGNRIKIGNTSAGAKDVTTVRVAGILAARGFSPDMMADSAIITSDSFFTNHFGNENEYNQVNIIVEDIDTMDSIIEAINKRMNRQTQTVSVEDSRSRLNSISQTFDTMTTFILAIGGISLVVAAVSIFNVMMMSVNDRIQEIGILRSIGTERAEIRRMFVYEAIILGIIGAGVGGFMSLIIGYTVVNVFVGNTKYFFLPASIAYVPYGMIIGILVCLFSGLYPAWKASNMDPIDALRSE